MPGIDYRKICGILISSFSVLGATHRLHKENKHGFQSLKRSPENAI